MSLQNKVRKLIRDPKMFWDDFLLNRKKIDLNVKGSDSCVAIAFKINDWKREYLRKVYPEFDWFFVPFKKDVRDLDECIKKYKKKVFVIWGYKEPLGTLQYAKKFNIPVYRMEDGFVRSVGLGSNHELPLSLVLDKSGTLYFDARRESGLEKILNEYDFDSDVELMKNAKMSLDHILNNGVSKYNHLEVKGGGDVYNKYCKQESGIKRILVVGQVEDDASITFGCDKDLNNYDLVAKARFENPKAQIFFKPHPDVLAKKRKNKTSLEDIEKLAFVVKEPLSISDSLINIDEVYTISSLSGFEALIRDIKVTTLGCPFYSGWGLTRDLQNNLRRKRKLTKLEMFAGAYILYPDYFNQETYQRTNLNETFKAIGSGSNRRKNTLLVQTLSVKRGSDDYFKNQILKVKQLVDDEDLDEALSLAYQLWDLVSWDLDLSLLMVKIYRKTFQFDSAIYICEGLSSRVKNWNVLLELFFCLQGRGDKGKKIEIILRDSIKIAPINNHKPRLELIRYLWGTYGVGPSVLDECNFLVNKQARYNLTSADHMMFAAIYCEAGRYILAERQYFQAISKDEKILNKIQYFNLMRYLSFNGKLPGDLRESVQKVSHKLERGQSFFESFIMQNKNSFCIVGNGPSEIGSSNGDSIDENKVVIRFNAFKTTYPECLDYGKKTDIWVKTGSYMDVPRRDMNSLRLVIISGYNPSSRNSMGLDLFVDAVDKDTEICTIPAYVYEELFEILGATPSAGLAIVYWIYKIMGPLKKENVYGMSFGKQEKHCSEHYFKNNHKVKYSSHLWESESFILEECIA